jgi:hypothetical protein
MSDKGRAAALANKLVDRCSKMLWRYRLYEMDMEAGGTAACYILLHPVPAEGDAW